MTYPVTQSHHPALLLCRPYLREMPPSVTANLTYTNLHLCHLRRAQECEEEVEELEEVEEVEEVEASLGYSPT